MMTTRPRQSGFTGFELLIVAALVGLLAWLVVGRFNGLAVISRDTERRVDINILADELESFHANLGHYPPSVSGLPSFPRPEPDGQTQVTADSGALFDPDGQLTQDSPTASTNAPATGYYGPERPDGPQYTYAPYSCNPIELPDEAGDEAAEAGDEAATDETGEVDQTESGEAEAGDEAEVSFDRCQQYVIYAWLESGGVYFKVSQAVAETEDEAGPGEADPASEV